MELMAVYGTLKSGKSNHYFLGDSGHVGMGRVSNEFTLAVEGLPYLVKRNGKGCLVEVYEVDKDTMRMIDRLEGHPNFYRRELTDIFLDNGVVVQAWVYIHPDNFPDADITEVY